MDEQSGESTEEEVTGEGTGGGYRETSTRMRLTKVDEWSCTVRGASPRSGLGWTRPPYICQRPFQRLM